MQHIPSRGKKFHCLGGPEEEELTPSHSYWKELSLSKKEEQETGSCPGYHPQHLAYAICQPARPDSLWIILLSCTVGLYSPATLEEHLRYRD
ncbi:hypothetical protein AV530_009154 [Patagioenas fasciata monilis]|uniref:Uncharacterized protein n=1 Tax=Patagioenas fasciata monilis TaxID=372326 RepID=A0A1V4IWB6_PATFA|nr:hypothetical protein AV530_009154 [Patagioenas fasciata monilis]